MIFNGGVVVLGFIRLCCSPAISNGRAILKITNYMTGIKKPSDELGFKYYRLTKSTHNRDENP